MKRKILGAAFILAAGLSAVGWAVQYPITVTDVDIVGIVEVRERDVLEVVAFCAGDEVSESDLRAASQAIFDLGWFGEVVPEVGEDGTVMFHVIENPRIREIVITGNTHRRWRSLFGVRLYRVPIMPTSRIRRILGDEDVEKRAILDRDALETGLTNVIAEYNERGYVLIMLGDVELGETLRIEIMEAELAANTVTGLTTVPTHVAEEMIDLPLGEPVHVTDLQDVYTRLRDSVYFSNFEVVPQAGPDPNSVILQWQLEERDLIREPVRLSGIVLEGITRFEEQSVYSALAEIPTGPVDNYGLLQILEGVYDLYMSAGYMMVRFGIEGIDDGTLHVRIDEGRIGRIVVNGLERTKEYVVLRNLTLREGGVLTVSNYRVSHQGLTSLGYFASVDIAPEWIDGMVEVTVTVKEKTSLGGMEGSMALDPASGALVGEMKINQKNLFGTGQDISLSYSRGIVSGDDPTAAVWDLAYTSVAFFPEFDSVGLSLYRSTEEITSGEETTNLVTYGVKTSFAYPIADYVNLGITYTHEEERSTGATAWVPTDSVTMSVIYDDIDSPTFPTRGTRRSLGLEKAGGFSAGREFTNVNFSWIQFTPADLSLFGTLKEVVGIRLKVGWGDDQLPTSRYYELGGTMSVRGLDGEPTVPRAALANVEYRLELAENGLYLTAFLDAGLDLDSVRFDAMLASTGLEIGVDAAGIFVRLDIAWPLSSEWEWMPRFEVGFGRMF